jgi:hypothetical protein
MVEMIDNNERCEPWNRLINDHPLLAEIRELKMMSPADKAHYASTLGGQGILQYQEAHKWQRIISLNSGVA